MTLLYGRCNVSRMIKSSHCLFRLPALLIVILMRLLFSLEVVIDSGSHTIIGALNNHGLVDLFVIWELSWRSSGKGRHDLPVWRCRE